ncbi:c-type cytochrome [Flavitalea sp. BT771]|uniref:c-type cytochrome n=1 Tax=Flavitalea sp. BT771 TaxID=3063329 RepID=UPI0026E38F42|nr:c-type cytochrome [Flavitalea sp. BT771]MDO6430857.1 c-type cytochrome [Flavitalea sp. BT771]MDV6219003.1 c-type cytochrome [Flavitalea sp. BT771]
MKNNYTSLLLLSSQRRRFIFLLFILNFSIFGTNAQSTSWLAPKDAESVKNPLIGNASMLAEARVMYAANCGPCHGDKGRGDGPAAPGLNPKPADHTSAAVQAESDGSLFWKLSEGRSPMPGYKKIFSEQQRWELITYIRSLAKTAKKK